MANQRVPVDSLISQSYSKLPLDKVLAEYQNQEEYPKRFPTEIIFSRLQYLEGHFKELEAEQRRLMDNHIRLSSEMEDLEQKHGNARSYLTAVENGMGDFSRKDRKRAGSLRFLSELETRARALGNQSGEVALKLEFAGETEEVAKNEVAEFREDYAKELEFVYSEKVVDEAFALARVRKFGKFKPRELRFMVESGVVSLDRLYDPRYLNADRRVDLATLEDSEGGHLIPTDFLREYIGNFDARIDRYTQMIADAERLGMSEKIDRAKFDTLLQGFVNERDVLYQLITTERTKEK